MPVVTVVAEQLLVGSQSTRPIITRSRLAHLAFHAPEVEMLHSALSEILAFRDELWRPVRLDDRASNAALAKLDGKCNPYRATSHNDDLRISHVSRFSWMNIVALARRACIIETGPSAT